MATGSQLTITGLFRCVIDLARQRVYSGEVSERALARRSRISQPHLHNVLKGIRTLSPDAMDRLMEAMGLGVPQILWSAGGDDAAGIQAVPILKHRIGPGTTASLGVFRGYMPFPASQVRSLGEPVVAYLSSDLALPSDYRSGDLALLDQNPALRVVPQAASCWVVAESAGLRVRYVRRARGGLEVGSHPAGKVPEPDDAGNRFLSRAGTYWR